MTRIHFGKFKGQCLDEVPLDYLAWLADQPWLEERFPKLADAVADYLESQEHNQDYGGSPSVLTGRLVKRWHHELVKRWHPDRDGGSHAAMVAVNDARDLLLTMLAKAGAEVSA